MENNFFDENEMAALLNQLNAANLERAGEDVSAGEMSKEMAASQRRYEEYIKKHEHDNN